MQLDRVEIESVGSDLDLLAGAIIAQLPAMSGAVPIYDIARALDIDEIQARPLLGFEGCLIMDRLKSRGAILVNGKSSIQRQRFTCAHELGHFLNERHWPEQAPGFLCTGDDVSYPLGTEIRRRQEREANRFAIALLAPPQRTEPHLWSEPDFKHILSMARALQISREAAARVYVARHTRPLAIIFSHRDRIRYIEKGTKFPRLTVWAGDRLSNGLTTVSAVGVPGAWAEATASGYLKWPEGISLYVQKLTQANDFAMHLLMVT